VATPDLIDTQFDVSWLINQYSLLPVRDYSTAAQNLAQRLIDIDVKFNPHQTDSEPEKELCFYRLFKIICDSANINNKPISALLTELSLKLLGQKALTVTENYDSYDESAELLSNYIPQLISEFLVLMEQAGSHDYKFRLAAILLFSAAIGGLANLASMNELINKLQTEKNILTELNGDFYIELEFQNNHHETNSFNNAENQFKTLRRWFVDPLTLAAIIGFKKTVNNTKNQTYSTANIVGYISKTCSFCESIEKPSPTLFLKACGLFFQRQNSSVDVSLKNYASGAYSSASMSIKSFYAINNFSSIANQTLDSFSAENIESVGKRVKNKQSYKHVSGVFSNAEFMSDLFSACKEFNQYGHRRSQKDARRELTQIGVKYDDLTAAADVLLDWVSKKLEAKNWCNKSAIRSLNAIGDSWLEIIGTDSLEIADGADMQILYEAIFDRRAGRDSKAVSAIYQLFQHAHTHFEIALPDNFFGSSVSVTHVRSEIVSEQNFQRLRSDMQKIYHSSPALVSQSIDIIIILANRLFMRPGEIYRLRLRDIEVSEMCWITIRASCWKSLKTWSAKRMLPTKIFLMPDEFNIFQQFVKLRRHQTKNRTNALIFSQIVDGDVPLFSSHISKNITKLLSSYSGENTRPYSLRHTGVSALQLILLGTKKLRSKYLPYSAEQITEIKSTLASNDNDKYYVIASLAGHLTPEITLSTYAHFTDLLLGEAASCCIPELTLNAWVRMLPISARDIKKITGDELPSIGKIATPTKLIASEAMKLCTKSPKLVSLVPAVSETSRILTQSPIRNIDSVNQILSLYDYHGSCSEVLLRLDYDAEWVNAVINAAIKIKNSYITTRGKPRLFPHNHTGICPIQPASNVEKLDLEKLVGYFDSEAFLSNDLKRAIHHIFGSIAHEHPEILFKEPNHFKFFMNVFANYVPKKRWYVSLIPNEVNVDECISNWKKRFRGDITISAKRTKNKNLYPYGQLSVCYVRADNLQVIQTSVSAVKFNKYGSNALKSALHTLAIFNSAKSHF
jgi:integrase